MLKITNYKELDLDYLKFNHQMIHYFGLGFIQLKLDQFHRLHFYTEELPTIVGDEEIHNHRYDFISKILRGTLTHYTYQLINGNSYIVEDESCQVGVLSNNPNTFCDIKLLQESTYAEGSEYWIDHQTYHRVAATNCITLLERSGYKKEYAQVIRPLEQVKVCPFSMKVEEAQLWQIIEKMLQ